MGSVVETVAAKIRLFLRKTKYFSLFYLTDKPGQTPKIFCKTDFDMKEIKKEEAGYVPLPKFYTFKSRDERERILYKNFVQVGQDVKEMIKDVQNKRNAK